MKLQPRPRLRHRVKNTFLKCDHIICLSFCFGMIVVLVIHTVFLVCFFCFVFFRFSTSTRQRGRYVLNLNLNSFSLGKSAQAGKGAMRLTLYEAPARETRPDHYTGNSMPYSFQQVRGFFNVPC